METRLAIPYSAEWQEERVLDLFLPEAADGRALLLIHGGGWSAGSRAGWHSVAQHFCERGLVCASTRALWREGRRMAEYSLLDYLHGYVYGRWP